MLLTQKVDNTTKRILNQVLYGRLAARRLDPFRLDE